jgi:cell wall-associated NlpC family hydrolase
VAYVLIAALLVLLFISPMLGILVQPWAGWWFPSPTAAMPPGTVPSAAMAPPQGPLAADASPLMRAVQPYLGTPYLFGGCGLRGIDCSCFTQNTARELGYSIPRTAQTQYNAAMKIPAEMAAVGDLVFFKNTYQSPDLITHVGWYVGDGMMISAAEPAVGRQSLSTPFWRSHFAGFGRLAK